MRPQIRCAARAAWDLVFHVTWETSGAWYPGTKRRRLPGHQGIQVTGSVGPWAALERWRLGSLEAWRVVPGTCRLAGWTPVLRDAWRLCPWCSRRLGSCKGKTPRCFFELAAKAPRQARCQGDPGAKMPKWPRCQGLLDSKVPRWPGPFGFQGVKALWIPRLHGFQDGCITLVCRRPGNQAAWVGKAPSLPVDLWKHGACLWCGRHGFAGTPAPTMARTPTPRHRACPPAAKVAQFPRHPGIEVFQIPRIAR
jgi:hypothetical protein